MADLLELFRYRELLFSWIVRELQVRYKQSILGILWAVLQPLALMLIFSFIFEKLVKVQTDGIPYPVFSYTALLPWTFLSTAISFAVPSLVTNMNLVTKIYFPREIFPLSTVAASLVDLLVASLVFVGLLVYYHIQASIYLLYVPVVLCIQIILVVGIALFASAINVLYRDVRFVVPLALQLWLYASPIIYPISSVPANLRPYYMLNPMAGIIDSFRKVILLQSPPAWESLGISALISLVILITGYYSFKRMEPIFADVI